MTNLKTLAKKFLLIGIIRGIMESGRWTVLANPIN